MGKAEGKTKKEQNSQGNQKALQKGRERNTTKERPSAGGKRRHTARTDTEGRIGKTKTQMEKLEDFLQQYRLQGVSEKTRRKGKRARKEEAKVRH